MTPVSRIDLRIDLIFVQVSHNCVYLHCTPARDFGTLIPQIKSYSRDLCPGIKVNPEERLKIMRRDSVIRLQGLFLYRVHYFTD